METQGFQHSTWICTTFITAYVYTNHRIISVKIKKKMRSYAALQLVFIIRIDQTSTKRITLHTCVHVVKTAEKSV